MIDPTRFVADPAREKRFPELPYMTLAAGLCRLQILQRRSGLGHRAHRASGVLSPAFMHKPLSAGARLSRPAQADMPDGGGLCRDARQGLRALPLSEVELFRAADAVRTQQRTGGADNDVAEFPFARATMVPRA